MSAGAGEWIPGVHRAPNIIDAPDVYEIENVAADPDRRVEAAIASIADWRDRVVLDLGAGTGYHVPIFHDRARHVFAVEPHAEMRLRAMRRVADLALDRASVLTGSAEKILLPSDSVDVLHARFAYFWGRGCEPGLREVERVLAPGGTAFIIDNDWSQGLFARWLRRSPYCRNVDPEAVMAFWEEQGFSRLPVLSEWRFSSRSDLRSVIEIEFPAELAAELAAEHEGLSVSYGYAIYHRTFD